jgi:REP element-mobilizing transposase RayT
MPKPRKSLVSLEATPYYHCVSRCVRRAFLCGEDTHTGKNFEHRRQWIENRLLKLSTIFAIDIAAYAVMSNHYHVVLHINKHKATAWSERDVIEHWHKLFKGNLLSQKYLSGEALHKAEKRLLNQIIEEWRDRLSSISWFMRCANEPIARAANHEDNVSGRFWEGRFTSQALLDEKALAACMAYVDLNPIRAKMANTPEQSEHTSIQRRIKQALHHRQPGDLYPFVGNPRKDIPEGIPFQLTDYLELVDWTGRILREDKRGAIPDYLPAILQRLNIDTRHWIYLSKNFESPFKNLVGTANNVRAACDELGKQWTHGIRQCEQIFSSG